MPLVYRAVLSDAEGSISTSVERLFVDWMRTKGLVGEDFAFAPAMSTALAASDQPAWIQRRTTSMPGSGEALHRIRLIEETPEARWTTTAVWTTPAAEQQVLVGGVQARFEQLSVFVAEQPAAGSWVWLDLENEPVGGRPLRPASPRLVRDLMAVGEAHDAELPLTADPWLITSRHVTELAGYIRDPRRRVPIVVFSHDPLDAYDQDRLARNLARDLAGVAAVFRLADDGATATFEAAVPHGFHVYGGALRTYLPGAMADGDVPSRHRVLGRTSITTLGTRAFPAVKGQILHLSTERPPPLDPITLRRLLADPKTRPIRTSAEPAAAVLPWLNQQLERITAATAQRGAQAFFQSIETAQRALAREIGRLLDAPTRERPTTAADNTNEIEALKRELAESEGERQLLEQLFGEAATEAAAAKKRVVDLADEADFVRLELAQAERDGEVGRRRVRYLEGRVRELGAPSWEVDPDAIRIPDSVVDVLALARVTFHNVVIGHTDQAAAELDVHPHADLFAIKSWAALSALNDYASQLAPTGGNFLMWCQSGNGGSTSWSAANVAMVESEPVEAHPVMRGKRVFAVPDAVSASGMVYMPAHIKVARRLSPAPRLHFYDDTGGSTGKVYVGYLGPHLPTPQFR